MEASDVFAGNEIANDADPFEGTDFGDFGATGPTEPEPAVERPVPVAEDAPIATEGLPTVDREGNPIGEAAPAAQVGPTPEAQSALDAVKATAPLAETHMQAGATVEAPAVAAPAPASAPETAPEAPPEPPAAQNGAQTAVEPSVQLQAQAALDAVKAEAAAEAAAAPQPTPVVPEEGPGVREPEPDPTAATAPAADESATSAAAEPAPAESGGQTESDDGEITPPAEKTDKTGRVTHRRYLILRVDGNGKYTEVTWYEKAGSIVSKGTSGAKRQKYALARGQEDALKIGYAALGAPPKANIVAVALSSFQPRVVEPEAPKPERARLKIS